nr:integrase, catalytic region, zinc finger, CCHC-type, peptidase aspartic, catalytic [Tanacetum cinerariifolium]
MPSKDNLYNGRKGIGFENPSYFKKAKDFKPTLYDEKVIGIGYTLMFLTHSDEALEIEKFKRSRENKIEFAYDYGNLNASYQTSSLKPYVPNVILEKIIINLEDKVVSLLEKEKANLETIESLKSKGFESSKNVSFESENQTENDSLIVEKEYDKEENPKVIAPGMFKLNVSQCVSPISMSKSKCDSNNDDLKLKRKRRKRKSSKQNVKQVDYDVLHANSDFVHFLDLDTFNSVRRPKNSEVIWKKKGSSNTSNVDLSAFLGTVRFRNNDFSVIAGYGDVVIGSMTIKKVYYVEAKASSSQSWLWHQRLSYLNSATINNLVKNNLVQGLPKMKFEKDHLCSTSEQGKIHQKHHKSKTASTSNKPLYLLHMDFCGPIRIQSINGKRYVLVIVDNYSRRNQTLVEAERTMLTFANLSSFLWAEAIATACFTQNRSIIHKHFDKTPYELINNRKPNIKFFHVFRCRCYLLNDYEDVGKLKAKGDIGVFVGYSKESAAFRIYNKRTRKIQESVNVNFDEISDMASKQFSLEPGLSNLNETRKSSNLSVSQEEVILPQTNTHLISINMIHNGDEASTSHNVFNKRLEDAYFDVSKSCHDPSNVHTYYQPYPYENKWTKDHPLHKIIGDPKSSVRTRGQPANSCLFSCLLGSIKPANVAEALKDAD